MIYLIGGPPRVGKTTLAKIMSKKLGIPWISTDMLETVSGEYMTQVQWNKTHPYSVLRRQLKTNDEFYRHVPPGKIMSVLRSQARATIPAITMAAICEIKDGNDYIIEGYHIEPSLVRALSKKHGKKNIRAVFLTKYDAKKFALDVHKSTTPNDWLLAGTKDNETFYKVGAMVALYSRFFEKEANTYGYPVFPMDDNFKKQLREVIVYLVR